MKEIFAVNEKLKELGIQAKSILQETRDMYTEYEKECSKVMKQFESIVFKAKTGLLVVDKKSSIYKP